MQKGTEIEIKVYYVKAHAGGKLSFCVDITAQPSFPELERYLLVILIGHRAGQEYRKFTATP